MENPFSFALPIQYWEFLSCPPRRRLYNIVPPEMVFPPKGGQRRLPEGSKIN
jgi:hypothetical protein